MDYFSDKKLFHTYLHFLFRGKSCKPSSFYLKEVAEKKLMRTQNRVFSFLKKLHIAYKQKGYLGKNWYWTCADLKDRFFHLSKSL